jgi:uncharacterized protein YacL (UPF0231 family)
MLDSMDALVSPHSVEEELHLDSGILVALLQLRTSEKLDQRDLSLFHVEYAALLLIDEGSVNHNPLQVS